jgi:hypothetical protein
MLIKQPPPMVMDCASARIGPHSLEINLSLELGNHSQATPNGDAFSPQSRAIKDAFLLRVYHSSR